ncbi:hypothetical protein PoB_000456700 [Plakobranchus ocellatus]|uniref:Uncharacterized protein n=1 Tax=Plakobranchus ocellatus TaxID=259542 RepID=A0AAV3Y5J8_9GAST|nr:hypothetical protein PoB_000456700 [Plakobranchus ocellatus]
MAERAGCFHAREAAISVHASPNRNKVILDCECPVRPQDNGGGLKLVPATEGFLRISGQARQRKRQYQHPFSWPQQ